MPRLPSLQTLRETSLATFKRFPFVLFSAITGTAAAVWIVDVHDANGILFRVLLKIIMTCALGLTFLLSLSILADRRKLSRPTSLSLQTLGLVLLVAYALFLPARLGTADAMRFALLIAGMHLLVSFSPYLGVREINGFWQFNKTLFLRILTAVLYSGVMYIGLSIALLAVDKLFSIIIVGEVYAKLWIIIAGVFNTWFFLAGVPDDFNELELSEVYPKGLKVFTQYVLLPLVTIYLVILYFYEGKIILTWQLPVGWVSNLVLGFSIAGILSLLLIHPIREREGNAWIVSYARWFYRALFPLVGLLLLAIWTRISEYGVTENRYVVLVLGLWLLGIAVYFSVSTVKNIKVVPVSLCLIAFLISVGPWGAFAISERSQLARLEQILTKEHILVDGKIKKTTTEIPFDQSRQVSSIVSFFVDRQKQNAIREWFAPEHLEMFSPDSTSAEKILALMGLPLIREWQTEQNLYFTLVVEKRNYRSVPIEGYEYFARFQVNIYNNSPENVAFMKGDSLKMQYAEANGRLKLVLRTDTLAAFDLFPLIDELKPFIIPSRPVPHERMIREWEDERVKVKIIFNTLNGYRQHNKIKLNEIEADVFLGMKQSSGQNRSQ